jgi:nucleotide-binding universal stress UspA family protein
MQLNHFVRMLGQTERLLEGEVMYKKILVPVDGSATSNRALDSAVELAKTFGASMRLVHVIEEAAYLTGYDPLGGYAGDLIGIMRESGNKLLAEAMARVDAAGVKVDAMLFDKLGERLAETVANGAKDWGAELIVLGTHGRRGVGRLLMGSGAEQIIRLAPVPVLVVRDETPAG